MPTSTTLRDENHTRWTALHQKSTQLATRVTPSYAIKRILAHKEAVRTQSDRREILEVGCGFGRNLLYLIENGFCDVIHGVDQTPVAVESSRALLSDYVGRGLCFLSVMDAGRGLAFADNSFDCVFDIMSAITFIPQQEDRQRYWSEVARILKPGGVYMFLTVRAEAEARIRDRLASSVELEKGLFRREQDGMIEKCYTAEEIRQLTRGLDEVELSITSEHIRAFGDEHFDRQDGFWFGIFRKP